jgi:diketogulonate reductase-like aldo/keto reductase
MSLALQHSVKLSNGATMPVFGFGTWQAPKGEVALSVREALKVGFRHIDCARVYQNEAEIGEVFAEVLKSGDIKREELFVTSKLWNTDHDPLHVEEACRQSLADLQVGYLDLYLIHWPVAYPHPEKLTPEAIFPFNGKGGTHQHPVPMSATWEAMEKLVDAGLVKSIGISNCSEAEAQEVYDKARIKPVTNQVECHPACPQNSLRAHHKKLDMILEGYCPLGIGMAGAEEKRLIAEPEILQIAKDAGLSAPQLLLRWSLQSGNVVLSKSVTPSRIAENAQTLFGGLSPDAMAALAAYGKVKPFRSLNLTFLHEAAGPFFPAGSEQ